MLNYSSFGAMAALLGPWLTQKPDLVYAYNLVTLGWPSRVLRALKGCKVVLDIQDLWPEGVNYTGMLPKPLEPILDRWCNREYRSPDRIVTLSPGFRRRLIERGIPDERVEVIYNWCDEEDLKVSHPEPAVAKELGMEGRFNIVFAGTMGKGQALDAVVAAARLVAPRAPEVLFTFVGGGIEVERLKGLAEGLPNVQFLPRRPVSEIGRILAVADVLLVHLRVLPLFSITIPSKVQAYMYVGKPILLAVPGDAAVLVERAGAGVACQSADPGSIAAAAMRLYSTPRHELAEMGRNGRRYYDRELAMAVGVDRFIGVFERTLAEQQ
jgi:glycosyltransferase involved in cell wall biosynthesis